MNLENYIFLHTLCLLKREIERQNLSKDEVIKIITEETWKIVKNSTIKEDERAYILLTLYATIEGLKYLGIK